MPPVLMLTDFQFRIQDESVTGEGNRIRLDIMHPLWPMILVLPFDRLVFADFLLQCRQILSGGENGNSSDSVDS